jgi:hypothetical protein
MFGIDATAPAGFPRLLRSRFLRGLKLTLTVVAVAWLAAPSTAFAYPTDYVVSNASAVLAGTPYSITGLFSVEGNFEYFAQFQITGPGPLASSYSCGGSTGGACPGGPLQLSGPGLVDAAGLQIRYGSNPFSVKIDGLTDTAATGVVVPATGGPTRYSFYNASTVLNGDVETITGTFGFDPLTLLQYGAQIFLTGPAPYAGNYFFDLEPEGPNYIYAGKGASAFLKFIFANNLSSADADPLASLVYEDHGNGGGSTGATAIGLVVPDGVPVPAPEPTSLALLSAAIGLFLLSPRGYRRRAPARQ